MAWHTITRSCGHGERVQVYGPTRDRDRKAEAMAGGLCEECYRAGAAARHAAEADAAEAGAKADDDRGMPRLDRGPLRPAEAARAAADRRDLLPRMDALVAQYEAAMDRARVEMAGEDGRLAEMGAYVATLQAALMAARVETSAAWWLDRAAGGPQAALDALARRAAAGLAAAPAPAPAPAAAPAPAPARESRPVDVAALAAEAGPLLSGESSTVRAKGYFDARASLDEAAYSVILDLLPLGRGKPSTLATARVTPGPGRDWSGGTRVEVGRGLGHWSSRYREELERLAALMAREHAAAAGFAGELIVTVARDGAVEVEMRPSR